MQNPQQSNINVKLTNMANNLLNKLNNYIYDAHIEIYVRKPSFTLTDNENYQKYYRNKNNNYAYHSIDYSIRQSNQDSRFRDLNRIFSTTTPNVTYVLSILTNQKSQKFCQKVSKQFINLLNRNPQTNPINDIQMQVATYKQSDLVQLTYAITTEVCPLLIVPRRIYIYKNINYATDEYPILTNYRPYELDENDLNRKSMTDITDIIKLNIKNNTPTNKDFWPNGIIKLKHDTEKPLTDKDITHLNQIFTKTLNYVISNMKNWQTVLKESYVPFTDTDDVVYFENILYLTPEFVINQLSNLQESIAIDYQFNQSPQKSKLNLNNLANMYPQLLQYLSHYLS